MHNEKRLFESFELTKPTITKYTVVVPQFYKTKSQMETMVPKLCKVNSSDFYEAPKVCAANLIPN